jgi:hypothetical protein
MQPKRYIALGLAVAVLPLLALSAINILVDPYNELGFRRVAPVPLVESSRTQKLRLLTERNGKPDAIVFGSSRMMEVDPGLLGKSGFNLSVDSAMPEDLYALTRWLESQDRMPRVAFIGIDFNMLNPSIRPDARLRSALPLFRLVRDNPAFEPLAVDEAEKRIIGKFWRKYLARKMLLDSLRAIDINVRKRKPQTDTRDDGMLVRTRDLATRAQAGWKFDPSERMEAYIAEKFTGYSELSAERIALLDQTFDVLSRHNVKVILVLTPYHPALLRKIHARPELVQRLTEVRRLLQVAARDRSWRYLDATEIQSIPCQPKEMWDLIHLMPECALRLANKGGRS